MILTCGLRLAGLIFRVADIIRNPHYSIGKYYYIAKVLWHRVWLGALIGLDLTASPWLSHGADLPAASRSRRTRLDALQLDEIALPKP